MRIVVRVQRLNVDIVGVVDIVFDGHIRWEVEIRVYTLLMEMKTGVEGEIQRVHVRCPLWTLAALVNL